MSKGVTVSDLVIWWNKGKYVQSMYSHAHLFSATAVGPFTLFYNYFSLSLLFLSPLLSLLLSLMLLWVLCCLLIFLSPSVQCNYCFLSCIAFLSYQSFCFTLLLSLLILIHDYWLICSFSVFLFFSFLSLIVAMNKRIDLSFNSILKQ